MKKKKIENKLRTLKERKKNKEKLCTNNNDAKIILSQYCKERLRKKFKYHYLRFKTIQLKNTQNNTRKSKL